MPKFNYTLSSTGGRHEEGSITAPNREAALQKLRKENKIILSCDEDLKKKREYFWQKPSFSFEDKMLFTKHLYAMVRAGITITEALQIFINQTKGGNTKAMFENILNMIKSGQSLSKSLKVYNYIFSDVFVNMIATGEESGTLEQVLLYLGVQLEKEYDLRKKLKAAFIYPAVLLSITVLMALGIVIFIMPKVLKIFASFNVVLPLPTRMLIWLTNFLTGQWYFVIAGIAVFIFAIHFIVKIKGVRDAWHSFSLHLPVFGKILINANLARFARTLNSLLQSGVSMTKALAIVGDMISNNVYKGLISEARLKVEQGAGLGDSFSMNERYFPQLFVKLLAVGDKTGSVEDSTGQLAELYEKDVDNMTKNLSVLLEPILLVFMGAVVGGLALSIIMPIYQLPNMIHR
jgi:type II secretory pathway component PulF